MKVASLVARYLLGIIFLVFGANGFLHFIPMQPMPPVATQFVTALAISHYMVLVFLLQLVGGILLLANRFVPLALTLLAPIIVNIVLTHLLMAPAGLPIAILVVILWVLVAARVWSAFTPLLQQRVES
ncbi:hypothetical protein [Granulicella tundricola]|uniref:DoxX family protein n=1 Tax=Granulicella tundricola (strain ATCC BAA-1859 / DSM 23138 / MP5ACTX9) TaxID=1198114 RepID=E8X1X6_GRATM|nr:hypothetical protein [Granulicella tundricola]ADW69137.1 hypothetical protein AciX9_2093 [Granulicella tundricola MP5ACTX9]